MIKISIKKDEIIVKGHSGYSEEGSDIVCAAVSSICITTVNALVSLDNDCISYEENDGFLKISLIKHNEIIDKLITNMVNMLKELEIQYKKYIEIR